MEELISMYIDDELSIDEKIQFVKKAHKEQGFMEDSISLLEQESYLRADFVKWSPSVQVREKRSILSRVFRPAGIFTSGVMATAAMVILFMLLYTPVPSISEASAHRFVIYKPDADNMEITGTFTGWEVLPMNRLGSSGYWDITMNLSAGEHRFTYVLDKRERISDPTIQTKEHDDFGGENSILFKEI